MSARWWRRVALGSVALITAATLLPFGATPPELLPPRWCLACGGLWGADAVSNVVLFLPLGVALAGSRLRFTVAVVAGLLLSLLVEGAQSLGLPPGRSPAIADLLTNTLGAALGWLLLVHGPSIAMVRARAAAALAGAWLTTTALLFIGTAAAEQRRSNATPTRLERSPLDYSPGYGWYGGSPVDAVVETSTNAPSPPWRLEHAGSGPIVAQMNTAANHLRVQLRIIGYDSATYRRSAFYLHLVGDTAAELVVAQRDHAAELLVRRRAFDWGLALPVVRVAGAFTGLALRDTLGRDTVLLDAKASSQGLSLRATRAGFSNSASVALTPALGWAMLQTLVTVQSPIAPLVHGAWLLVLFLPVGWFAGRSAAWGTAAVTACGTLLICVGVSPFMGVSRLSMVDDLLVALAWLLGLTLGRLNVGRVTSAPPSGIIRS